MPPTAKGVTMGPLQDEPWLDGIQGEHARALIRSNDPLIRVVAGPGTGKTTCLKRRVQRLLSSEDIAPSAVFVGTFTRAIAHQLRADLTHSIRVATLHSFAYELLRQHPQVLDGMRLRFLLQFEENCLIHDLPGSPGTGDNFYARRDKLRQLEASRARREDFDDALFIENVHRWLRRHRAMLIGEVVYFCVKGLESRDINSALFDQVVIDEYQDLTAAEQEMINLIWSTEGSLMVMGDNDQSIYSFRYNHPAGISEFDSHWPNLACTDLSFLDNRRCGAAILSVANMMRAEMGRDCGAAVEPLVHRNSRMGTVHAIEWESLNAELEGLARYISINSDKSFHVLVPRRIIGYRLAQLIGPDARTAFTEQSLEHAIAQEAFTAASLVAKPSDAVSIRAWLGFHGAKPEHAQGRNRIAYTSIGERVDETTITQICDGTITVRGPGSTHIRKRAQAAKELLALNYSSTEFIDYIFDGARADREDDEETRELIRSDLDELRTAAHEILNSQTSPDLARLIDELRYRIATRAPLREVDQDNPRVQIMTLHSAKGLEADNVIVAGIADQILPGRFESEEQREEQRRLLYVAITRAKSSVVVSWPRFIPSKDNRKIMPRHDPHSYMEHQGEPGMKTSRSSVLPQGLSGVVPGTAFVEVND